MISTVGPALPDSIEKSALELAIFEALGRGSGGGDAVAALEQRWAAYVGADHAVATGSGATAIHLALAAIGIRQGDEVIVPALAPLAAIAPVAHAGARLVFADVDAETWTISPESVQECLTHRTRAVLAVHLFGRAADVAGVQDAAREGAAYVDVIEDAAEAAGARINDQAVGSLGRLGCFHLSAGRALGNAGLITTSDGDAAQRARVLVQHGCDASGRWVLPGLDYRLDALIAAFLRLRIAHLDEWMRMRARLAKTYDDFLTGVPQITVQSRSSADSHVYQRYVIQCDDPEGLQAQLAGHGVQAKVPIPVAVPDQPVMRHVPHTVSSLDVTRSVVGHLLSLPIEPDMGEAEASRIGQLVRDYQVGRHGAARVALPRREWRTMN